MIGLSAFLLRVVLLVIFTFGFVVLYEHGPQGWIAGVSTEWKNFESFLGSLTGREETAPADLPGAAPQAPVPPPPSTQPAGAWKTRPFPPLGLGRISPVGG